MKARFQLRARLAVALIRGGQRLLGIEASDGDFSTCVYCGTKGCDTGEAEHASDCPLETGIFPVALKDMWPGGPAVCESCKAVLWPGAMYSVIPFSRELEGVPGGVVACTGCALLAQVGEEA